jgi:NAD(P)H-hydrate epimerase
MTSSGRAPPVWVLTAEEMRRWDRNATASHGIPERLLMENAGRAAARALHDAYPDGSVCVVVGPGRNGGDAVVVARTLHAWGRTVTLVPARGERELGRHAGGGRHPEGLSPTSTFARAFAELSHGWDVPVADSFDPLAAAEVVVDGVLGTGATGAPRGREAAAVAAINAAPGSVVALDGPTGVDLSDGSVAGDAVRADLTIAFGALKRGLLLHPGRKHAGRILIVEVGFPPLDAILPGAPQLITADWASAHLPIIPPNAHKGLTGSIAVIAGRKTMGGAPIMVAMGALRAGCGLVRVLSDGSNRAPLYAAVPEAIFVDRDGPEVDASFEAADAVVAGPGMGTDDSALRLLARVLEGSAPVLLDADAITILADHPELIAGDVARRVLLTPHPGEMARLLGVETSAVVSDPFKSAGEAAERFGCAILLKSYPALVATPGARPLANATGHAGVATGGMGDTLAGVAGAMLGMGATPRDAAALAIYYAGRAAEVAGRGRSLLPRDVAEALPSALSAGLRAPAHPTGGGVIWDRETT